MINQSTAEGHHVLHCAPKCWSRLMLCNWKLAHKKRVHAAVHRQSDWSNRKYSLSVPTRPSSTSRLAVGREGKGREGRAHQNDTPGTQSSPSSSQAPEQSGTPALFWPVLLPLNCACPSRVHFGGNGRLRLVSFPATPAITATLAPPALSGCARSGPHHERADEEGAVPDVHCPI